MNAIDRLLDIQDGVISRRQALGCGLTATDVSRRVRRRDWSTVHPGVYVAHTGPLTWRQRAWAAVLACGDAALDGRSAVRAHEHAGRRVTDDDRPIEVLVRQGGRSAPLDGVRIRQSRRYDDLVQRHLSPPRLRYEDAIILLADRATREIDRIATLADACGSRRTTPARLLNRIEAAARVRHRASMRAVLADIAQGTCSVLEHAYLTRVERAHGLPRGLRQVPAVAEDGRRMFRDVVYAGSRPRWRQIIELDGRLGHEATTDRDRDLERDLDAALSNTDTIRLGYGQVLDRACSTAAKVGRLLELRGWRGHALPCPACPGADRQRSAEAG